MKKTKSISILCAAALLLSACGGSESATEDKFSELNKNAVFKEETGVFASVQGDITQIRRGGDIFYVEQYRYDYDYDAIAEDAIAEELEETEAEEAETEEEIEEISTSDMARTATATTTEIAYEEAMVEVPSVTCTITGYKADGTVQSQWVRELGDNCGMGRFAADAQGNIYTIWYEYATYEGEDMSDRTYLEGHTAEGSEIFKILLSGEEEEDYFYVNAIFCIQDQLILNTNDKLLVFDTQGNPVKEIEKSSSGENGMYESELISIRDDKVALLSSDGNSAGIQVVDIAQGTLQDAVNLPFNYYRYTMIDGNGYDLYLNDDYGIYGYNIGDTQITKVMDYISSDFGDDSMYNICFVDAENFIASYYGDDGIVLAKFHKVAPEDVGEKVEVTIGCYYLDYNVKKKLIDFNKSSEEYRVNIMDYSMYDTMDDYTQGMTRLNTDIVSGNVPDIMILSMDMPVNTYISKGVFADLYPFLEKGDGVKKEDLLPNVLEALASEDGLYRITPSFSVNTFVAKTADVGETPGWTMEEALAVLDSKPEGTKLLSDMTSSNFVNYALLNCGERYIDWEKGECYFDSDEFIKILEFADTLPREIDYSQMGDDDWEEYWNEMEVQYRNGKTILSACGISTFRDYAYIKQATFGEDITMIGFPVEDGVGAGLSISNTFSISAMSSKQDAAWEFIQSFFEEEYQDSLNYNFPVRISSLEKKEKEAWENPYYLDENGNKQEYEDTFYINGMDIPSVPLTKEETGKLVEYIKSLDNLFFYDESILQIVSEETESYFAGQKSAEEVASIIQSRVKIYINENS